MITDPEGTEMIPDTDPRKTIEDTLDVVLGTQRMVERLIARIRAVEARVNKLESELEPQLIELTKLLKEVVGHDPRH